MKLQFLGIGVVLGAFVFIPAAVSSGTLPESSQQAASATKGGQSASESSKGAIPFPEVPRITAEEVQRMAKDKGNVVLVDTDDSESYAAEHIKGAVNVAYDPTADVRSQDDMLSALPGDKLIVFYCNCAHEEDSAPMVLEMQQLGYDRDKVKALKGGLTRWEQLGYPLVGTDVRTAQAKAN